MKFVNLDYFFDNQIEAIDCNSFRLNWNELGWVATVCFWNVERQDMDIIKGEGGSPSEAISHLLKSLEDDTEWVYSKNETQI